MKYQSLDAFDVYSSASFRTEAVAARRPMSAPLTAGPRRSSARKKFAFQPSRLLPDVSATVREAPDGEGLFLRLDPATPTAAAAVVAAHPPRLSSPASPAPPACEKKPTRQRLQPTRLETAEKRPATKRRLLSWRKAGPQDKVSAESACVSVAPQEVPGRKSSKTQMHIVTLTLTELPRSRSEVPVVKGSSVDVDVKTPIAESGERKEEMHTIENREPTVITSPLSSFSLASAPPTAPRSCFGSPTPPATIPRKVSKSPEPACRNEHPLLSQLTQPSKPTAQSSLLSISVPSLPSNCENIHSTVSGSHTPLEEPLEEARPSNMLFTTRQTLTRLLASPEEQERTATIVFDLDETLCNNRRAGPAILRPGAAETLRKLRALYPRPALVPRDPPVMGRSVGRSVSPAPHAEAPEGILCLEIIIWTASMEVVARSVIASLDPDGSIIDDVIYRDVRWYRQSGYTKDLRRIGRPLDNVVIVENAPSCVSMNRGNAILVTDFISSRSDRQMIVVRAVLQEWLANMSALVFHRHLHQTEKKRMHLLQDGGESQQPDKLSSTASITAEVAPQSSSASNSTTRSRSSESRSASNVKLRGPTPLTMQVLECKASAISFLKQNPFLSPATRYVKPSKWREAMRLLNGTADPGATEAQKEQTAGPTALPSRITKTKRGATGNSQPGPHTRSRSHCLFADIARELRETLMK